MAEYAAAAIADFDRGWGNAMKKLVLAAALFAAASVQGVSAADRQCYSAADIEAEQAILF